MGLLGLFLAFVPGCVILGVVVIKPDSAKESYERVEDFEIRYWRDVASGPTFEISPANSKGVSIQTNNSVRLRSPSLDEVAAVLGVPDERGEKFIRYRTGKRAWRGVALDFAIFPIPLTIPLIAPGEKIGYVDFVLDRGQTRMMGHGAFSKFYGYAAADNGSGWFWGTQPGFWFNPD